MCESGNGPYFNAFNDGRTLGVLTVLAGRDGRYLIRLGVSHGREDAKPAGLVRAHLGNRNRNALQDRHKPDLRKRRTVDGMRPQRVWPSPVRETTPPREYRVHASRPRAWA